MVTSVLFGSGVSYISKIPGIKTITERIVSGENIGRAADSIYYLNQGQDYLKHHVQENLVLIGYIKNDITSFYKKFDVEHDVNYEDIYYVLKQIKDSFSFEFENPGINCLIEKLQATEEFSGDKLQKIVNETAKYIQSIVWQMISYRNFTADQFDIVPKLIEELNLSTIISLNHDLVLDTYLQKKGIEYDDGFKTIHYKYPQWVGFDNTDKRLKLYKLHGSVNWFEVAVLKPRRGEEILILPNDIYIQAVHHEDEAFWGTLDGTPKLLIGTFNKMLGYLSDIFETLYDAFKIKLKESNVLLISGYGFADKGINTQLSHWLNHESSYKMIIIHPFKGELIKKSRGNFRLNLMNENSKHPKVELIEKKFEEVTIEEILESINR